MKRCPIQVWYPDIDEKVYTKIKNELIAIQSRMNEKYLTNGGKASPNHIISVSLDPQTEDRDRKVEFSAFKGIPTSESFHYKLLSQRRADSYLYDQAGLLVARYDDGREPDFVNLRLWGT